MDNGGGYNDYGYGDAGGAYGAADGGGFVQGTSPGQGMGGKRGGGAPQKNKSLIPISIKQLEDMQAEPSGEGYLLDGREVYCVRFVARLDDIQDANNAIKVTISDSTGRFVVDYYPDIDDLSWAHTRGSLVPGCYVDLVAQVKAVGGGMLLTAFSVRRVVDSNQITHHLFATLHATLERQQGPLIGQAPGGAGGHGAGAGAFGSPSGGMGGQRQALAYQPGGMVGQTGAVLDPRQVAVFEAFKVDGESDEGANTETVFHRVAHLGLSLVDVHNIAEQLVSEGLIYSTVDENTFKTTS